MNIGTEPTYVTVILLVLACNEMITLVPACNEKSEIMQECLTLSDPIFLPPTYSPALIYFGQERGWWITCNYPTVLKEKNMNRKSITCAICWLKSVLHEEKRQEQENHNVGRGPT
jgi:hypothetical protein